MCIESRQRLLLRHCCCHHCRIHPATIGANKMAKSCPKAVYIAFLECSADFLHIVCSVGRLVHHLKLPQVLPSYTEASIESAWSPTDSMRIKPWLCRWSTRHTMARVSKFWGSLGLPCCLYVWCVCVCQQYVRIGILRGLCSKNIPHLRCGRISARPGWMGTLWQHMPDLGEAKKCQPIPRSLLNQAGCGTGHVAARTRPQWIYSRRELSALDCFELRGLLSSGNSLRTTKLLKLYRPRTLTASLPSHRVPLYCFHSAHSAQQIWCQYSMHR